MFVLLLFLNKHLLYACTIVHSVGLQILLLNFFFVLDKLIFSQCAKSQGMLSWMVNFRFAEGLHWNICRGLQGLHWNTEKRDLLQFLFCPQVQFDFECERTLRTGANMNWIFCSCIKKIKKENVTAAENLKIRPLVFSSQRTNFKSTQISKPQSHYFEICEAEIE